MLSQVFTNFISAPPAVGLTKYCCFVEKHFIIFYDFLHTFVQNSRLTYGYKSDFPKHLYFFDTEKGSFISTVFYFKPYLSANYFNGYCLSHFDSSSSGPMNQTFVTSLVGQYCFLHTQCQQNSIYICVSILSENKQGLRLLLIC